MLLSQIANRHRTSWVSAALAAGATGSTGKDLLRLRYHNHLMSLGASSTPAASPATLDWLIIGGGLHGCHLAHLLRQRTRPAAGEICVLDPNARPLAVWETLSSRVGMDFLRSPSVHHIDADPMALQRFSYDSSIRERERFLGPYSRPSLALFRAHSNQVLERSKVHQCWLQGEASEIRRSDQGWAVTTSAGTIHCRRLVLAIGMARQPAWPSWARQAVARGSAIQHLFDDDFHLPPPEASLLVIGGGITAAQFALAAIRRRQRQVTLLSRHPLRAHTFDSDPGWMGPKYLDAFHAEPQWQKRRETIVAARQRGTMPEEVLDALRHHEAAGHLCILHDEPRRVVPDRGHGEIVLELAGGGFVTAAGIVLCTGFTPARPGGPMLDGLVATESLPVAACGYPVTPPTLEWAPGLFVMGALGELQLGPVARNIAGARMAASRILAATTTRQAKASRATPRHRSRRIPGARRPAPGRSPVLHQQPDDA